MSIANRLGRSEPLPDGSSGEPAVAAISTSDYYANQITATVKAHNMQLTQRAQSMEYTAAAQVWDTIEAGIIEDQEGDKS